MRIDNLNDLPEWNDLGENEDKESWKGNSTLDACKEMYKKWSEIMIMLNGALGSLKDIGEGDESFATASKALILNDAYEVAAKIRSSGAVTFYLSLMESAAIIRRNAQAVKSFVLNLMMEGSVDHEHGEIIRLEIDVFKSLFIKWVNTFEKDEMQDEWGLF